jgi:hypothetical protein
LNEVAEVFQFQAAIINLISCVIPTGAAQLAASETQGWPFMLNMTSLNRYYELPSRKDL